MRKSGSLEEICEFSEGDNKVCKFSAVSWYTKEGRCEVKLVSCVIDFK